MSQRAANRDRFPFAAQIVDELRAVFGPSVKPTYVCENGAEVGKAIDESQYRVVHAGQMVLDTIRLSSERNGGRR